MNPETPSVTREDTTPDTMSMDDLSAADQHDIRMKGTAIYRASLARLWGISAADVSITLRLPDHLTMSWSAPVDEVEVAR